VAIKREAGEKKAKKDRHKLGKKLDEMIVNLLKEEVESSLKRSERKTEEGWSARIRNRSRHCNNSFDQLCKSRYSLRIDK